MESQIIFQKINNMKTQEIGIATITYDNGGRVIKELTNFVPTLKISITDELNKQFAQIRSEKDEINLKKNSDIVLATWFSKMNEIELADRDKFEIKSEIIKCEKYANERIKQCVIRYTFKEIK